MLTFFGFMHGEAIGIAQTPTVAVSYLAVGGILLACSKLAVTSPQLVGHHEEEEHEHHGMPAPAE